MMSDTDEHRQTLGMPDVLERYPVPGPRTLDGLLGFELREATPESAHARARVTERACQRFGLVHGGVYCALAEMLATEATLAQVWPDGMSAVGLSNHTNFMRPVTSGLIDARGQALHRGRTTWVWNVSMTDDHARRCASAVVTIAVRPRPTG
jgi:1,4-dihydroxy-2-naphthoyl-CoA hydrolase